MSDGRLGLAHAVRQRIDLGRLLPLGAARDGAWIAESAAVGVLRRAVQQGGTRVGSLRIGLLDDGRSAEEPAVPPPPGALPPGPLRITAQLDVLPDQPVRDSARSARAALISVADELLGLNVSAVDLEITGLLDEGEAGEEPAPSASRGKPSPGGSGPERDAAEAALTVDGVAWLDPELAAHGVPGVRVEDVGSPAARRVRLQLAVAAGHRALDVARAVRKAVAPAVAADAPGPVTVSVVVSAIAGDRG